MTVSHHPRFAPERQAADAWDWLSAQEVMELALSAYYATCRSIEQWSSDAEAPADAWLHARNTFADDLVEVFTHKLNAHGFGQGVPGFTRWDECHVTKLRAKHVDTHTENHYPEYHDIHRRGSHNENAR